MLIYLLNGIRLQGRVMGFDQYVVSIRDRNNVQMVYKRNISTIVASAEPGDRAGKIVAAVATPPQGQEKNDPSRKTLTVRSRRKLLTPGPEW